MKPISEVHVMDDTCPKCRCQTSRDIHSFYCSEVDLGTFDEPCTITDWGQCPINIRSKVGGIR